MALTERAALIRTVQVAPDTASHPVQPVTRRSGLAVSVTTVSKAYGSKQSAPQLMPDGLELTLPSAAPKPVLLTVRTTRCKSNVAVTVLAAVIVTVHVAPVAASHPIQLAKVDPAAGAAVSVTVLLLSYVSEQSVPQLIPDGLDVTVPEPAPARTTVSTDRSRTLSVVLAVAPVLSVAVIVVVP